jgi:hypothetical protein
MATNTAISDADQPAPPREARGVGKIIQPGGYGHVEVTVAPSPLSSEIAVEWGIVGGVIPERHRIPIIAAIDALLADYMADHLLKSVVTVTVDYGSFHHTAASLHVEAARRAVTQALRRGDLALEIDSRFGRHLRLQDLDLLIRESAQ